MAQLAQLSTSSSQEQNQDYLSINSTLRSPTDSTSQNDTRRKSISASSIQTCTTQVEVQEELGRRETNKGYKAYETKVVVQLSWWQSFKGILRPWRTKSREVTAVVVVADEHGETMDIDNCPWIPTVHVLSREKDEDGRFEEKIAKCMIDTGNLQGNLISKDFLVQHLGHSESEFMQLKESEKAGSSVSGHQVTPEGAVKLTWYHPSSIIIYRDMRFLVMENAMYDMVLCAQAIEKHKIVNPPNFGDVIHTSTSKNTDPEEKDLKAALEKAQNDCATEQHDIEIAKAKGDKPKVQRCQQRLQSKQKELKRAEKASDAYAKRKEKAEESAKSKTKQVKTEVSQQLMKITKVTVAGKDSSLKRASTFTTLQNK